MNLKLYLLSRIAAVALICLCASVAYVLDRSERQSRTVALNTMDSVVKQLEYQLLMINAGYNLIPSFPDLDLWKQTSNAPGICIRFVSSSNGPTRSLCNGVDLSAQSWPSAFENLYRLLLNANHEWERQIVFNGRSYGVLTVSSSIEMAIAHAWDNVRHLLGLSIITILAVSALVYLIVNRVLQPAQVIINGLNRMAQGDLAHRLPDFKVIEWRNTASAVNQLAEKQQLLLNERRKLAIMLMNLQEEERRFLARELHDEIGQCLAAINAVATSIVQTAQQQYPLLIPEAKQISRFIETLQNSIRGLLTRLRPVELEELGLADSLRSLVARWNRLDAGKTSFRLHITGDSTLLPEPLAITLFRIIQEGISNITKHAEATQADISLDITADDVLLTIADNGKSVAVPFTEDSGIGLLGMRERITALDGKFSLSVAAPRGLIVSAWLPLRKSETMQHG